MSPFSIRLARVEDAEAFHRVEDDAAALLREASALAGIPIPPTASARHHAKTIAKGRSLSATIGDDIVGFAAAEPMRRDLHLHELSVARAHQRRGIGATLLEALAIDARNSGFRAITLSTFRDIAWNEPFYARHRFVALENLESHPHLAQSIEGAVSLGIPRERRVAMIRILD